MAGIEKTTLVSGWMSRFDGGENGSCAPGRNS